MADEIPCGTEVSLTAAMVEELTIADGDWEVVETLGCEMQGGHGGQHVAMGQTSQDGDYDPLWVRWAADGTPEVVRLPPCEAETADEVLCLLPDGHEGSHTGGLEWWS